MILDDDMSEEHLAKLADHGTDDEKCAVARHPNASLLTLLYLAREGFVDDVDENPLLPLHVEVGSNNVVQILVEIAEKTKRTDRLEELSSSSWDDVRCQVATNEMTTPRSLEILAKDENGNVRRCVAINESTPSYLLGLLAKEQDWYIRYCVSENLNAPAPLLIQLSKDVNESVRMGVSKNPHTPPEVLASLAKDFDKNVRRGVAENLNTPLVTLSKLEKDDIPYVGYEAKATLAKIKKARK